MEGQAQRIMGEWAKRRKEADRQMKVTEMRTMMMVTTVLYVDLKEQFTKIFKTYFNVLKTFFYIFLRLLRINSELLL